MYIHMHISYFGIYFFHKSAICRRFEALIQNSKFVFFTHATPPQHLLRFCFDLIYFLRFFHFALYFHFIRIHTYFQSPIYLHIYSASTSCFWAVSVWHFLYFLTVLLEWCTVIAFYFSARTSFLASSAATALPTATLPAKRLRWNLSAFAFCDKLIFSQCFRK